MAEIKQAIAQPVTTTASSRPQGGGGGVSQSTTATSQPADEVSLSPQAANRPRVDPEAIHMTQVADPVYNPGGDPSNADCGPTSLAMGLAALGLDPPGDDGSSVQNRIDRTREAMYGGVDGSRDGVNADGSRNDGEHSGWTDFAGIRRGAERSGADTYDVHNSNEVAQAVSQGHPVVLAGNPNMPGSYGERAGIGYDGGHFITVSGYDPETDTFTINDPLSHDGPIQVSRSELDAYMSADNATGVEGVALVRGDGQPVEASTRPVGEAPENNYNYTAPEHGGQQGPPPGGAPPADGPWGGQEAAANPMEAVKPEHMSPEGIETMIGALCDQILGAGEQQVFPGAGNQQLRMALLLLLSFAQGNGVELSPETEEKVDRVFQGGSTSAAPPGPSFLSLVA